MSKLNWYFYKVWLPLNLLTLILLFTVPVNWYIVLVAWFILGPVATGVGMHRLFAHRSFSTHPLIEKVLAYLATLSAYAPILYWVAQHQYHHKYSDQENDPTSPKNKGIWYSFLYWRFLNENLDKTLMLHSCSKKVMKDKFLMFLSKHFTTIIWVHVVVLFVISPTILLSVMLIPILIETNRLNILNSFSHVDNFPFNYRNHECNDKSYNNYLLGYLSLGFGWHNNHHARPGNMIIQDKWHEIDIEGYIAYFLSRCKKRDK